MSEEKRATLISLGTQKDNVKKKASVGKTVRICLVLPESNEDTYPEYNYKEELAAAKKKDQPKDASKPVPNGLLDIDDDEDVKRIAREMEEKYGTTVPSKKSRKGRKDDYADIGMGYDESDSFIDNTDGYDEMIPPNVTTALGGFYVNSGALEFRAQDISTESASSDEDSVPEGFAKKKRVIESSDSEGEKETENDEKVPNKKIKLSETNGNLIKPKKKVNLGDKQKSKKIISEHKRKSATVRELLHEKRVELDLSVDDENGDLKDSKENRQPLTTETIANITDAIESVVKGSVDVNKAPVPEEGPRTEDICDNDEHVKLPENLPAEILGVISSIKNTAANISVDQINIYSNPMRDLFLNLETKCKCLGKPSRTKVYEHLAPYVKTTKEALIRRTKRLALENEENSLRQQLSRLKDEIDVIMPGVLENYNSESQKVIMKKFSKESMENEDNKQLRLPHRRFPWTEELKKTVRDIIVSRKRCLILEGKKKDSLESRLAEFVKQDLQILWPDGWMSITSLSKVCGITPPEPKKRAAVHSPPKSKPDQSMVNNVPVSAAPVISPTKMERNTPPKMEKSEPPKPVQINNVTDHNIIERSLSNLTELEISKTIAVNPTPSQEERTKLCDKPETSIELVKPKLPNTDIFEVKPPLPEVVPRSDTSVKVESFKVPEKEKLHGNDGNTVDHCQVIDLTCQYEIKRKPGPKSKTRYYTDQDKIKKPKSAQDEITGSFALNQIITNSLGDMNYSTPVPRDFNVNSNSNFSVCTSNADYTKVRTTSEGDDIQMVMEGLKNLQKMSSPIKSESATTSSPVSVIAFNKSYAPKQHSPCGSVSMPASSKADYSKGDFSVGFQDIFQKQLMGEAMPKSTAGQPVAATSKGYDSVKYPHISNSSTSSHSVNDKQSQLINNNHDQQNKLKNSIPLPPGPYGNLLDDMFSNILSEYGYSRQAMQKAKPHQKQ